MLSKLPAIDHSKDAGLTEPIKDFYSKLIQDKSETEKLYILEIPFTII